MASSQNPGTATLLPSAPAFESNARAIIDAARELHGHEVLPVVSPEGHTGVFAVIPQGKEITSLRAELEEWRPRPERARGTAKLQDEASFVAHVRRTSDPMSVLFCDPDRTRPTFTAVYDYHESSRMIENLAERAEIDTTVPYPAGGSMVLPRWMQHRALFTPRVADEWAAWTARSGKPLAPVDLAEFLEERVVDVFNGQPSEGVQALLESVEARLATSNQLVGLARNFAVNVDTAVHQVQLLQSGEISIRYAETHRDAETGQPVKVPNAFLIAIPVFFGGPTYQLFVRLRYRLSGGKITWTFFLNRPEVVLDHALREMADRIAEQTGLPLLLGSPEA